MAALRTIVRSLTVIALLLCLHSSSPASPVGVFQGELIAGPHAGVVFVRSPNGHLRRVQLAKAKVRFDDRIPFSQRTSDPIDALQRGALVRVTAEQDDVGEWLAREIVLLKLGERRMASNRRPPRPLRLEMCNAGAAKSSIYKQGRQPDSSLIRLGLRSMESL